MINISSFVLRTRSAGWLADCDCVEVPHRLRPIYSKAGAPPRVKGLWRTGTGSVPDYEFDYSLDAVAQSCISRVSSQIGCQSRPLDTLILINLPTDDPLGLELPACHALAQTVGPHGRKCRRVAHSLRDRPD